MYEFLTKFYKNTNNKKLNLVNKLKGYLNLIKKTKSFLKFHDY